MQKELILSIILIILIIIFDCITQNYTKTNFSTLTNSFQELETSLNNEDFETANKKIDEINKFWNKVQNSFSLYIEHTELDKLETSIILCSNLTKTGNYDLAITELQNCIFLSEHIIDKNSLTLKNIL